MLYFIIGLCLICWFLGIFAYAYGLGRICPERDPNLAIIIEALVWPITILFHVVVWIVEGPCFLIMDLYAQGRNDYYKNYYKKSS